MNKEKLIETLRRAGSVHGDYETNILNGAYDNNWPVWYAAYVVGVLGMEAIKPAKLTKLLIEAYEKHQKQNLDADWPTFYADYIINNLT